ncbi:helix-turn-helix domain-containing protein [Pedobacter cryoconitis]|uniref:Transcriptional regulator with XRE-family HTH domain n=1 Tax=Pedobacter cryoconitis TaxID=188932 RepID=A0A7X0J5D1_9SPHI|nr:helix-turn-helix transcriptional regulator [Pedobacter cryoconitis]MBB6501165.1 transcriptional regulator with XRE-family HTH domain [Pedobacter cryoconitis]
MTQTIGMKLRMLRKKYSINQEIMASKLGISVTVYSRMERGVTDISFKKMQRVANIYNISMIDLLNFGEQAERNNPYSEWEKQLAELNDEYNKQQKKMIQLYEIIREQKSGTDRF